jgi:hypothetical protein
MIEQGSGVRGQGSVEAGEQAFDVFRQGEIYCFGLLDERTGLLSMSPTSAEFWEVDAAISFLKAAWGKRPPKMLAMDGGPPACHKRFREFLDEQGVAHRCLDPVDQALRGRLKRAGKRALTYSPFDIAAELLAALKKAKTTIKAWHGKDGWEIYDECSPEMKTINAAIAKAQTAEGGEGLELAKRILKLNGGTNIMSEKLCPICSHPVKHKKGCPYPLAEKLVKKLTGEGPPSPQPKSPLTPLYKGGDKDHRLEACATGQDACATGLEAGATKPVPPEQI